MSFESNTGLGVPAFYGTRTALEGLGGHVKTEGAKRQMVLEFSGRNIVDGVMDSVVVLPANALVTAAYVDVNEAITTPGGDLYVGVNGTESTNGVTILSASAAAAGVYDITSTIAGTFTAGLLTDTEISVAAAGTPTLDGRLKVVVEYVTVTK